VSFWARKWTSTRGSRVPEGKNFLYFFVYRPEVAIFGRRRARRMGTFLFSTIPPLYAFATGQGLASGAFPMPTVDARSDSDPRALTILHEWVKTTGAEMNEARLRLTRIPQGADLILNKVSGAPGFWIGNVIVMAGVPSIILAMLDEVAPKLKIGVPMLSERRCARMRARATSGCNECGAAPPRCTEARACKTRGRGHAGASAASTIE